MLIRPSKKYVELIPDDPNPHDSYAELLMKRGRFAESIAAYEKALSLDPNFVASHVGIGKYHQSRGADHSGPDGIRSHRGGRAHTGERRLARFWTAASYVQHRDGQGARGIARGYALAEAERDSGSMSGDLVQMGDVLREAGRLDDALAKYTEAVKVIDQSAVPQQEKDATRRNHGSSRSRRGGRNDFAGDK